MAMASRKSAKQQGSATVASVPVRVTKFRLPRAPGWPALSGHGRFLAIGGRGLSVFDLAAERKGTSLSLRDPNSRVVESKASVEHVTFTADGGVAYRRGRELVVSGNAVRTLSDGQVVVAIGSGHAVLAWSESEPRKPDTITRTEVVEIAAPIPIRVIAGYPYNCAYDGNLFWLEWGKQWASIDPKRRRTKRLDFVTDISEKHRLFAVSSTYLVHARDGAVDAIELATGEVTRLAAPKHTRAIAIHDTSVLFADDKALHLYDAPSGRKLWSRKASVGAIAFAAGGSVAVATLVGSPPACLVIRLVS